MIDALLYIILVFWFLGVIAVIPLIYMLSGIEDAQSTVQIPRRSRIPDFSNRPYTNYTYVGYGEEEYAQRENMH